MNQHKHIDLIYEDSELQIEKNSEVQIIQELCNTQERLNIKNTEIYFPHKLYDIQVKYMESVVQIQDKKCNGLKEQQKLDNINNLKIIYASKTHAQLKQVAKELKRTVYTPNISMVDSRDQYCLKGFQNLKGNSLIQTCRNLVKRDKCQFYNKDTIPKIAAENSKLINFLEESKQFWYNNKVCPYYFEGERLTNADLIQLPYPYLQCI